MMVGQDQDLGLSLSLNFPEKSVPASRNTNNNVVNPSGLQLNLTPSVSRSPFAQFLHQKTPWMDSFPSSSSDRNMEPCRVENRSSFLKGIDVNRMPAATGDAEDEAGVSSPNSTLSSISGKRSEREPNCEDIDLERASSRGLISDEEDGDNSRKKLRLSKDQSAILEESFKEHNTLNPKQKLALAKRLGLRPRQVEVWFQNRRARTKLKQTEVDCEYLKRCCESLTEENRRLQKEVQELRALKMSPQFYMQMTPPTTLTMCPSCERVAVPPQAPPASAVTSDHHHQHNQSQRPMAMSMIPGLQGQNRPMPFNPWAAAPAAQHRPFDALHGRS